MSTDLDKIKYYLQRAHDGQGSVVFNEIGAAVDGLAERLGEIEQKLGEREPDTVWHDRLRAFVERMEGRDGAIGAIWSELHSLDRRHRALDETLVDHLLAHKRAADRFDPAELPQLVERLNLNLEHFTLQVNNVFRVMRERIARAEQGIDTQQRTSEHLRSRLFLLARRLGVRVSDDTPVADLATHERRAFALQFAVACLYALGLAPLRERYERWHLTELTVIGGVLLSLAPAAWLARQAPTSWTQYERRAARGFVTVAVPITVWQTWLFLRRLRRGEA